MKDYNKLQNGSDIRGVALKLNDEDLVNLSVDAAKDLSLAFAKLLTEKLDKKIRIAIGRDSRLSGEALLIGICEALNAAGIDVVDCGLATTPSMFMSCIFDDIKADGSIMITASHLPANRNGLKFFTKKGGFGHDEIAEVIRIAEVIGTDFKLYDEPGNRLNFELIDRYSSHLRKIICDGLLSKDTDRPLSKLHVVVDAGNGAGGFYVEKVLKPLGANCEGSQFLNPDGSFPNHIPNPENAEAMKSISDAVVKSHADLGIIFDTDVDRASAVASNGKEISRNAIVALAAVIASQNHPGTTIVTDSITSTQLTDFIEKSLGCKHLRFKRGYKNVIDKGIELNAAGIDCQLAIETSGHAAMKENYFLDDGAYLATKVVIEAAKLKEKSLAIESLLESLGEAKEAKEYRFSVNDPAFADYAQKVLDYIEENAASIDGWKLVKPNYEGVRVDTGDGWFLIRKSLHDPQIPLNIESDIDGGVIRTYEKIKTLLKDFDKLS